MCFSRSRWTQWAHIAKKCLDIGSHCTLCARSTPTEADICKACEFQFRLCHRFSDRRGATTSLCMGCGDELSVGVVQDCLQSSSCRHARKSGSGGFPEHVVHSHEDYCTECSASSSRLFFHRIIAPYRYVYPVDQLIKRIKYREDRQLARVFGTLLGQAIAGQSGAALPQLLLPMPLHASRLKHRGYNQAADIAQWAGRHVGLPVAAGQVRRVVDTGSLAGLSRQARQQRILGAFRASDALVGKHVAIVDDVLTTGASARELAREIYDSGAESVELWVLARTSRARSGA